MKRFWIKQVAVAMLSLVVLMGIAGCGGGDDDPPPANITGMWASTLSGTRPSSGPFTFQGSMTITQNGQNVSGSYSYVNGDTFTFTGTYVDGAMNAVDSDSWTIQIVFEGDSGEGTMSGNYSNGTPGVETVTVSR